MGRLKAGKSAPLGAHFDGQGINFALFSAHAQQVELCLFDAAGKEECLSLPARSGDIWHGYLPAGQPGQRYGFRVSGPFDPQAGHRFNRQKLLLDPCARAVAGDLRDDPRLHGGFDTPDPQDSAAAMPKCVVTNENYDWQGDCPPNIPWGRTVIYEAHVRGLTQLHPEIPEVLRGSYAALAHPVMINYLKQLGVTALELLPIQQHANEPHLQRLKLNNYWGYNVLAPYAVEPRYACGQQTGVSALSELCTAVKALHSAGIEVILDVVFNHSAELDISGPTLSLRGIDNASYYWQNTEGEYDNLTGCGNALRLDTPPIIHWVIDCLCYWVESCHIDGFRFDLGTLLGRTPDFKSDAPLLIALLTERRLAHCKLIVEPWDIGLGGYQLGQFPGRFAEWNNQYRDAMRHFWLRGSLPLGLFARRFAASDDHFNSMGRSPAATINFLTAHDGFTLLDLLCFNQKHNRANGEDNRDGHDNNISNNQGTEGLAADDATWKKRKTLQRALLGTLLLSQGTPMLLAGDEHGHSQQGNNNAYCQDNETTWLHWECADQELTHFTAALIRLRQQIPALITDQWWQDDGHHVLWLDSCGQRLTTRTWELVAQQRLQILLSQRWLVVINASDDPYEMQLPEGEWIPALSGAHTVHGTTPKKLLADAHSLCVLVNGTATIAPVLHACHILRT